MSKIKYLFAGDICYQSMRIEEKTPFPVHRYGFSYDVHRHKAITGTLLLKFLVEQCHEHDILEADSNPVASVGNARKASADDEPPPASYSGVSKWLKDTEDARKASVSAVVWRSEGTKGVEKKPLEPKDLYHESVAIVGETDLREKDKEGDSSQLRGFRLMETHTVSDFEDDMPKLGKGFFGTPETGSDLILNLDVKKFGLHKEFSKLKEQGLFGNLVTRLVIPRTANNQPSSKSNFNEFSAEFLDFLKTYNGKDGVKPLRMKKKTSVLVTSSESLRNAGFDISYRVTWERSISGIFRAMQYSGNAQGKKEIAGILKSFDYLVVHFYNDGALLIDTSGKEQAILVAIPSQTEGDHNSRFTGVMKGTESLLTACVAYQLQRRKQASDVELSISRKLQTATVHGLKASRYLQSHGYSTLHKFSNYVLAGTDEPPPREDDKFRAVSAMIRKLTNSKTDVLRYLWNRTRSTRFAEVGLIPKAMSHLATSAAPNSRICAWPLGDIIEILAGGYPMFGSFPPVALSIAEGREAVDKETRKVMASWNESGWIEVGRFDQELAAGGESPPAPFHPFWSLRTVAVEHLADALRAGTAKRTGEILVHHLTVARFLIAEMMIRFGTRQINRSGMAPGKHFDIRLLERVALFCNKEIRTPGFYGDYFENFDLEKFIENLTGEKLEISKDSKIGKLFADDPWLKLPVSGSALGIFPGFSIRKLHTIDRRDTQSYRDIRERLLGFQNSGEKKPLNLLVLGGPGSGKSFAVKEILSGVYEGVQDIAFLEYNVASFAGETSSITSAFLEIQNVALQDKLPVVFWDEYDTSIDDTPLAWLGTFLGPMQDGKFLMGQSSRFLPKCVFVFAGSVFARFDQIRLLDWMSDASEKKGKNIFPCSGGAEIKFTIDKGMDNNIVLAIPHPLNPKRKGHTVHAPVMLDAWRKAKGRDFKSRITGVLDISSVDWTTENETIFGQTEDEDAWLFRRAGAIRNCFEQQAKHLLNREGELQIANDTMFSFLTVDRFEHGYRSIESVIRMSSLHGRAIADGSVVPAESQVRSHSQTDFFHPQTNTTYKDIAAKFTAAHNLRSEIIGNTP